MNKLLYQDFKSFINRAVIIIVLILNISCDDNSQKRFTKTSEKKIEKTKKNDIDTSITPTELFEIEDTINKKDDIFDYTKTIEVEAVMNQVEFIDLNFYNILDSLVKFEKKCLNSNLDELHWTFFKINEKIYEFTAHSDFGGEYSGYTTIDNTLVFFNTDEPSLYKKTNKKREFHFTNKKFPYPEDYSVWILKSKNGEMKILKSYTLPCE
ncbi:MAG: hypothetical protein ACLGGV_09870 [Bacteroidia bacterium]